MTALATAASAQPPPQNGPLSATVTVSESLTLSLSSSTIAFGTVAPGTTGLIPTGGNPAETVTIVTNDPSGYSLAWQPPAAPDNFVSGSNTFPVAGNLTFNANGGPYLDANAPVTLVTTNGPTSPSGDQLHDGFLLSVPTGVPGGAYSTAAFSYVATAL